MNKINDHQLGYSKGYSAGQKRSQKELRQALKENQRLKSALKLAEAKTESTQYERIFMKSLSMALSECKGWVIGGEKINNAEGYCALADVFASNAISKIEQFELK